MPMCFSEANKVMKRGATLTSGLEKSMFLLDLRSKPCLLRSLKPIPVESFGYIIITAFMLTLRSIAGRLFLNATSGTHFYFYQESVTSQSFLQD
ncbi:hypothetical protein YC2023_065605 [Brassica napus]